MRTPDQQSDHYAFLIEAAIMLHRYGTPSHRLERVMGKVAQSIGVCGEFLYTPTALVISLQPAVGKPLPTNDQLDEEVTVIRRVHSGPIDVDKLIRFDQLLGKVESGDATIEFARTELVRIDESRSLYGKPVYAAACSVACATVAVFFGGSGWEVFVAGMVGLLVTLIEFLHQRWKLEVGLLEPLAGVVAALTSLLISRYWFPIDDRLVTLAGLIVLIPGLRLTVALTELAVGHLSAGVARLAGAMVSLATLFVGVALVWRVADSMRPAIAHAEPLDTIWRWGALAIAPIAFSIVFRAGIKQWPIIASVSILGVITSWSMEPRFGIEVAAFSGALVVGCGSNLYARLLDLPALVPSTPGMLILVPGSLGYRSLSALLEQQVVEGVQYGFAMILIAISLVGGLLVSNTIIPPKRIL
ncbi:threonine/serine exporter family protein [Stieleria varia]|uniref:Threonine/serine exporter family protein n=1 Tax=Stieleria varia TaxID=2528005 RepID=A0A5C6BDL8_9BACT|nr:threonine/serine exporter family protein [Stieleria varia]TWU08534.1 hypothetical protein Pla52n_11170 [Stieleria varia]